MPAARNWPTRDLGFKRLDRARDARDIFRRTDPDADDDQFRIPLAARLNPDIFCLSLPVMMQRYPFGQGLVACVDAAETVAAAV